MTLSYFSVFQRPFLDPTSKSILKYLVGHVWPNIYQFWSSFAKFSSHYDRLIIVILHKYQYITTFFQSNDKILDLKLQNSGHVSLYWITRKFWLVTFSQSNHLIELKIHQNRHFITLFQSSGQFVNPILAQDGHMSLYPPNVKLQSLKIFNTLPRELYTI